MILESINLLRVKNLNKNFKLYKKPSDRLMEVILRTKKHESFQAISNVSFELNQGESLGIIGSNGAGKSTLMKLLTGLLISDTGTISTEGKIIGLIELGTGFNPELSGLVNIRNNALLMGMNEKELNCKFDQIVEFAEIGSYVSEPLKIYSSGMVMRLAFAIAIHVNPKCFLIDEALSVGDAYFQQKCTRSIMDFKENGGSLVLVSHDMNAIKMLCDKVLVLHKGRCLELSEPESAINFYNKLLAGLETKKGDPNISSERSGYGTLRAEIVDLLINDLSSKKHIFKSGEKITLNVKVRCHYNLDDLVVGFLIRDRFGQDIFGTNTYLQDYKFRAAKGDTFEINWEFGANLGVGKYTVTVALHRGPDHTVECLHWADAICQFEILEFDQEQFIGICSLNPSLSVKKLSG